MAKPTPEALRRARKLRIAARTQTRATTTQKPADVRPAATTGGAKTAFAYNPIYEKPSHLGPNSPGGFHFMGPPPVMPDAGFSYGLYMAKSGLGFVAPASGETPRDPSSGEPMEFQGQAPQEMVDDIQKRAESFVKLPKCPGCNKEAVTSADVMNQPVDKIHCSFCGADMTKELETMKTTTANPTAPQPVAPQAPAATPPVETAPAPVAAPPVEEPATAVQYEALSSIAELDAQPLLPQDVAMSLYDADSNNPFWTVDIKGQPVGRIYLQDQPKPNETRAVFISPRYAAGVAGAISTPNMSVASLVRDLKIRLWANKVEQSKLAEQMRQQATATVEAEYQAKVDGFKDKLLHCIALVCAGMDRNQFVDIGNPLKTALYASMRKYGWPSGQITEAIEAAFKGGSTPYFKSVLDLATAYMNLEPAALAHVEKVIGEIDIQPAVNPALVGESDIPAEQPSPLAAPTLASRLATSSVAFTVTDTASSQPVGYSDTKQQIRAAFKLGGASNR